LKQRPLPHIFISFTRLSPAQITFTNPLSIDKHVITQMAGCHATGGSKTSAINNIQAAHDTGVLLIAISAEVLKMTPSLVH
jgi:hypothetical protein